MTEEQDLDQQDQNVREQGSSEEETLVPFSRFLEEFPLNTAQEISGYYARTDDAYRPHAKVAPRIRIYCDNENCQGYRRFDGEWLSRYQIGSDQISHDFLVYRCRDCGAREKTFCIMSFAGKDGKGTALKIGEFPDLHIDLPSSLPKLLGEEYKIFVKGLKCEKQGFGIAAFAYYRRVVENQKGRVIQQIAKVAKRLGATPEVVATLESAANEVQFSKAIDEIRDYIPLSLLIDGHNPLKLLHKALSVGLHSQEDEACLRTAHSIRMVLQDLSQRIKDTLREEQELKAAVSTLIQFREDT